MVVEKLEEKELEKLDLDVVQQLFSDDEAGYSSTVVSQILPILRLLVRFNSEKTQKDQSYKNVLVNKLLDAQRQLKNISVTCSTVSSIAHLRKATPPLKQE